MYWVQPHAHARHARVHSVPIWHTCGGTGVPVTSAGFGAYTYTRCTLRTHRRIRKFISHTSILNMSRAEGAVAYRGGSVFTVVIFSRFFTPKKSEVGCFRGLSDPRRCELNIGLVTRCTLHVRHAKISNF